VTSSRKTLAFVVLAILALSVVVAATAQAAPEFEALKAVEAEGEEEETSVHATLDATQVVAEPIKLSLNGLSITCESVTASATLSSPSSTLTLSPAFSKCKMVVLGITFPTEIKVNSCTNVLHAKEETAADTYKAQLGISCPAEGKILITIKNSAGTKSKCLVHVSPQTGLNSVKVKDMTEAEPEDITLIDEVEGIKTVVTNGEEACGLITPGEYSNGKISGTTTVTATGVGEVPPPNLGLAQKFHFAAEEEEALFAIAQNSNLEFGFDLGKVKCVQMVIENPAQQFVNKTSTFVEATEQGGGPPYENCEINKEKVEIDLNVCWFRIDVLRIDGPFYEAGTYIENCFPKMRIEIKAPNCTIYIPQQSGFKKEGLRTVTLTNVGAGKSREVTATFVVSGMKYEEEGEGCKQPGKATANGTYSGTERLTAAEQAGPFFRGLWVEKT
jgi:hypothetical protein